MTKKAREEFLSTLAARFFAYNLLKRAFLEEPSKEFLELLKKDELLDFFPGRENEEVKGGVVLATQYLKESPVDESMFEEVASDYTSLFVTPQKASKEKSAFSDRENASPYESVYRSKKPLVFQEETIKVRREYMKFGLAAKEFMREPDDHIGLELDFMGHLGKRALDSLEKENVKEAKKFLSAQKRFLQNHLLKWVPKFTTQILKNARTDFYRGLAKILKGYLEWDKHKLAKTIEAVKKLEEPAAKK